MLRMPLCRKSMSIVRWLTVGVLGALLLASCQRSTPQAGSQPDNALLREIVNKTSSQRSFHVEVSQWAAGAQVDSLSIDYEAPSHLRIRQANSGGTQEFIALGRERFVSNSDGRYTMHTGSRNALDEYLIALRVVADTRQVTRAGSTYSVTLASDSLGDGIKWAEVMASPEGNIATLKLSTGQNSDVRTTYEFRDFGKDFAIQRPPNSLIDPMKSIATCRSDASPAPDVCTIE